MVSFAVKGLYALCVCGAAAVCVAAEPVYPRYAAITEGLFGEELEETLAAELLKDSNYHPFESIPIFDNGMQEAEERGHHPGVRVITFSGRLNAKPCPRHPCGYCAYPPCDCSPRSREAAELSDESFEDIDFASESVSDEQLDGGSMIQRAVGNDSGDASKLPEKDTCRKPICLTGRYLDVKGKMKRKRYGAGMGRAEKRALYSSEEEAEMAEEYDEEFGMTERDYTQYHPYYYAKKFHGGPPPKCTEVFTIVEFKVVGGTLQQGTDCYKNLDFEMGPGLGGGGCNVTIDCSPPPDNEPCDNDRDVLMLIDNSNTMGQSRLDSIVKPIALNIVDSVAPPSRLVEIGVGQMDESIRLEFEPNVAHPRSSVDRYIRQLPVTRAKLSLTDLAEQVAYEILPQVGQQRPPQRAGPAMLLILRGNEVLPRDSIAFETAVDDIYRYPNAVLPVCLLVDNSSQAVADDVARFCGCQTASNCPNLIYIDGDEPHEISRVARRVKQRLCRLRRRRVQRPLYVQGTNSRSEAQAYEWTPLSDSVGNQKFIAPGGVTSGDEVRQKSGSIQAAAAVSKDGLIADENLGSTYDPYSGYYYGKPNKYNRGMPFGQPHYYSLGGPGLHGHGQGYRYPPGADVKSYDRIFDTKNGRYQLGGSVGTLNKGGLINKSAPPPYPPQPIPYATSLPPQAPVMQFNTQGLNYETVKKSIGFDTYFQGVSSRLGQAFNVPSEYFLGCCAAPFNGGGAGKTFMGSNLKGGISYKVFVLDPYNGAPPLREGHHPSEMDVAERFRDLVGRDMSENGALGPYLSPRTTLEHLEVAEVAPYEKKLREAIQGQESIQRYGLGNKYQQYQAPPPGVIPLGAQGVYKILNINLTLCMYYLRFGEGIQNKGFLRGKSAGECLLTNAMSAGDTGTCEPFKLTDTNGLDNEVLSALKELEVITNDRSAVEAITREGGQQLALFDLGGGLPDPLGLTAMRHASGRPMINLCPRANAPYYKRPIRDAMRNLNKLTATL